jgi:hypothetical protein
MCGDFNVTACIDDGVDQLLNVRLISGDLDEHVTSSCPKSVYGIRISVRFIGPFVINAPDRECHGKPRERDTVGCPAFPIVAGIQSLWEAEFSLTELFANGYAD